MQFSFSLFSHSQITLWTQSDVITLYWLLLYIIFIAQKRFQMKTDKKGS